MQTPDDLDPYRSPRSETSPDTGGSVSSGQPLPWEPLDSFQFAFKQLRAYPLAILFAFVATLIASVIGMIGGGVQAMLNASGERDLIVIGWVVYVLSILVNIPIATWMAVGQSRCALAILRGRRPEFSELFAVKGAGTAIGAQILLSIVLLLIGSICLAPGLFVLFRDEASPLALGLLVLGLLPFGVIALVASARLNLLYVLAADGKSGVFDCLGASWRLTSGVFWLFVLMLLLGMATQILAVLGGLLLLCIGVIATVPAGAMLIQIATADAYLKRTGERPVGLV